VTFEFGKPSSLKITGIQKCAQFFLKVLLTTKGSDLINPSFGTDLPNMLIGANANLNSQELISQVTSSITDAVSQCQSLLNDTTNDISSKLSGVTISDISMPTMDGFTFTMALTTMAGETGSIALPTPLLTTAIYNG
jgi:CheY-like chemotaxis protein